MISFDPLLNVYSPPILKLNFQSQGKDIMKKLMNQLGLFIFLGKTKPCNSKKDSYYKFVLFNLV